MTKYFYTARPVWAMLYQVTTTFLPPIPMAWQLFSILWRWLGVVLLWRFLRDLWPDRGNMAVLAGLLFLLYPSFNLQWASFLTTHFWIVVCFFLSSYLLMLRAMKTPEQYWFHTIPAMVLSALTLWMLEYFYSLELIRIVVIFCVVLQTWRAEKTVHTVRRTLLHWLPYLLVFIVNILYRIFKAKLDKGGGPVATVLVQDGTLHVGDTFIAGTIVGKVRALIDDRGRAQKAAGPSTPIEVLGLGGLPQPGDTFQSIADAAKARQIALFRQNQAKERTLGARQPRLTLESLQQQIAEGGVKELPIIIKADVQGSAEVLADTLTKLSEEQVKIRIIHAGVGAINESDVLLASASNAIIFGFNVRPDRNAGDVAERERVDLRLHSVIYNVTDEIKKAMAGLLEPTFKEVRLGLAEVRQTFKVPKAGTVAGCMVTDGVIRRSGDAQARLLR